MNALHLIWIIPVSAMFGFFLGSDSDGKQGGKR